MRNPEYVLIHLISQLGVSVNIQDMCVDLKNHPDYPSLLSVSDVLNDLELTNDAANYSIEELSKLSTPFIVHLSSNNGEFALVNFIDKSNVNISNEWWSYKSVPIQNFKDIYSGTALVVKPPSFLIPKRKKATGKIKPVTDNINKGAALPNELPWKITLIDIGASYGLPAKWERFVDDDLFNLILVEPYQREFEKLKNVYPKARLIPYALGNENGRVDFNVSLAQSCSSVLEPNYAALDRFPIKKYFEVIKKIQVDIYRLDYILTEMNIPDKLSFVKIDVQGYEFEVLEGFGNLLDHVLCIELEAHLVPVYKNEKTLMQIKDYLSARGFYLRHLETIGSFEGEVIEFNAFFVKRTEKLATKTEREMIGFWESVNQIPEANRCLG